MKPGDLVNYTKRFLATRCREEPKNGLVLETKLDISAPRGWENFCRVYWESNSTTIWTPIIYLEAADESR